jgi:endonuclease G
MKIRIFLAALMLAACPLVSFAQQVPPKPPEHCADQVPYGFPQTMRQNSVLICRSAYVLLHDNDARVASWVAYTLTAQHVLGCEPRVNAFAPDQSLPRGQRAELADYAGSGFDTGHMANNADMSWSQQTARESFILSNMAPQIPALNRGAWRQLESAIRGWAFASNHSLTIYTGSIYDLGDRRIGPNGVVIPRAFYKIVVNNATRQSLAFLFPHQDVNDFRTVQSTVAEIERLSGIHFPIPDDRNSMHRVWNVELGPMMAARRNQCRG